MKSLVWLVLSLMLAFVLVGCAPAGSIIQSTRGVQTPSVTISLATVTMIPTSTSTPTVTNIETALPTVTGSLPTTKLSPTMILTPLYTLEPEKVSETLQPLIKDPLNCTVPCYWGIIPGKTKLDEVKIFFDRLGFTPFEGNDPDSGRDFYTITNKSDSGDDTRMTLYISNNSIENIIVISKITKHKEGRPQEWTAYSPETLIKKYGKPSRVDFYLAWPGGGGSVIVMNISFDTLIVQYTGENMLPSDNHSPRLCPLTAPFDYVRLWLGSNPPNLPQEPGIPLEEATSLTIDQFSQLMLGDPQEACFTINGDSFQ